MPGLNFYEVIGRLGKDPELRTMQSGDKVCSFSIATSEAWTDKASGERKENTQWHNIVIFNDRIAETAAKYLRKGDMAHVAGQFRSRRYTDRDGHERDAFELVVGRFDGRLTLLGSRQDSGDGGGRSAPAAASSGTRSGGGWDKPKGGGSADLDDEIPF